MRIAEYAESVRSSILRTPYMVSHSLSYEERPPIAGVVRGQVSFADGSHFYFKEYIWLDERILRLKYAYHYVSPTGSLVFRYDNALDPAAKAVPSYPDHKHLPAGISASDKPSIEEALSEAAQCVKRL